MTRTDARACQPIIPDPGHAGPTHPYRSPPAPRRPSPAPAGLPGQRPRPASCRGRRRPRRRRAAVDGKTLRGARAAGGEPEEVPAFASLLAPLDLAGVVVTADALQTHPDTAEFLVTRKHTDYLFQVKANQPTLLELCQRLPWHDVPVGDRTRTAATAGSSCAPSRWSRCQVGVPARRPGPAGHPQDPPAAHQQVTGRDRVCDHPPALQLARPPAWPVCCGGTGPSRRCTTSATPPSPRPPRRSAPAPPQASWRSCGTWRSGCWAGPVNVAAALRRQARDPRRPLATLGISLG
jgi:hypothetical protein